MRKVDKEIKGYGKDSYERGELGCTDADPSKLKEAIEKEIEKAFKEGKPHMSFHLKETYWQQYKQDNKI